MDDPDAGLPLWPQAAERYSPVLFAAWQAAGSRITQQEREAAQRAAIAALYPPAPRSTAAGWEDQARAKVVREAKAKRAVLDDLVAQLRRGDLIARGMFYEHGKPVMPSEWLDQAGNIHPKLWDAWREGLGERIGFGDRPAKFEVRRLRVYPAQRGSGRECGVSWGDRVHSIPPPDRAEGEAGEHGLWRHAAEEAEAEEGASEILAEFCATLPELPRLVAERHRSLDSDSLVFVNHDCERAIINELRAPLKEHFNQALRAGRWRCFGFSEDRGQRVPIGSPWRDGLSFDNAGGMTDERGGRYSDVLFYRAGIIAVEQAATAPGPAAAEPYNPEPVAGAKGETEQLAAKAPYRSKSQAVNEAIRANRENLKALPDRKSRARWIAKKTGCSESLAEKILKDEEL